jgi:hypothetical protein
MVVARRHTKEGSLWLRALETMTFGEYLQRGAYSDAFVHKFIVLPHLPPSPPTITSHHHLPPSPPTIASHHHLPPSPPTITSHHHLPPSPPTIASHHHLPPSFATSPFLHDLLSLRSQSHAPYAPAALPPPSPTLPISFSRTFASAHCGAFDVLCRVSTLELQPHFRINRNPVRRHRSRRCRPFSQCSRHPLPHCCRFCQAGKWPRRGREAVLAAARLWGMAAL